MAISKIILNGVTQIDLTSDTVAASNLISPNTAHGADGNPITGTATGGISGTYMFPIEQNNEGIFAPTITDFSDVAAAQEEQHLTLYGYNVAGAVFAYASYYENYEGYSECVTYGYNIYFSDYDTGGDSRNYGTASVYVTYGYYNGVLKTDYTVYKEAYNTSGATATADKILSGYSAYGPNGIIDGTASAGITPTGTKTISITQNGTTTEDVTNYASAQITVNVPSGSSMNVQVAQGVNRVNTTTYTEVSGQSLTVAKTGTYNVYWTGYRSSTSGTSGSQLYINDSAYGTAQTTFSNNGQSVKLTGVSLTQGQEVAVRARARNTSYYMYVGDLTIEQTA